MVGVEQRRPRAEFNSHFINLALVCVNCCMNWPISEEEAESKPRVFSGSPSSQWINQTPAGKPQSPGQCYRDHWKGLCSCQGGLRTLQVQGLAWRSEEIKVPEPKPPCNVARARGQLGPSRVKVAPRHYGCFSENRQAGRRLLWEVALTQMLAWKSLFAWRLVSRNKRLRFHLLRKGWLLSPPAVLAVALGMCWAHWLPRCLSQEGGIPGAVWVLYPWCRDMWGCFYTSALM